MVVFAFCLILGLAGVGWRTKAQADQARARARAEAVAASATMELQLNHAVAAAEVLGALVRQSGGAIPNFQNVANELLANHPGLTSLELQPGGIVSAIAPWSGNERIIGFNVFKAPPFQMGANTAIQSRALTVAGPMKLYRGDLGMIAMVPIYQRGRDGRESFWGFVTASMRLAEALARTHADDLLTKGYDYLFFAPASAQQGITVIAPYGRFLVPGSIQQVIKVRNVELRLALQPREGWVNKTKLALDLLGVGLVSGLVSLLASVWTRRREAETKSSDLSRQLAREAEDRQRAQEECRSAKENNVAAQTELEQARRALQQAESSVGESKARLEELENKAGDSIGAAETKLKAAEARAGGLRDKLETQAHLAREAEKAHRVELGRVQAALEEARQTMTEMQARLELATHAEKEALVSAQNRVQQDQATIAELQAQLDDATRSAQKEAVSRATALNQIETSNRELKVRLTEAEARVEEVTVRLREAEAELKRQLDLQAEGRKVPVIEQSEAAAVPSEVVAPVPELIGTPKSPKGSKRRNAVRDDQMDLFVGPPPAPPAEVSTQDLPEGLPGDAFQVISAEAKNLEQAVTEVLPEKPHLLEPKEHKGPPARHLPPSPVNISELRKAVHQILPLLADQDPGAKDCLKANRTTFRSAFASETYGDFEQSVKGDDFRAALEQLTKAVKKHGISV